MKPYIEEILILPSKEPGIFDSKINESGSHKHPAWRPLKSDPIQTLAEFLFRSTTRIKKVKIVITYEPKEA